MLLEIFISAVVCSLYSLACICFGASILRLLAPSWIKSNHNRALATLGTVFLLGQGILSGLWQLLALLGLLSPQMIIIVLILSSMAGVRSAWKVIRGSVIRARKAIFGIWQDTLAWKAIALLTMLLIVMTGIATIFPPQPRGDAIAFYMALPKVVAASHRLVPLPGYETFTQIGLQGELHFAALMSLRGDIAAKMFIWPTSLGAALMFLVIGGQVGLGQRGKLIALTALFTSTAFTIGIWDGKVDIFPAAMGLAAFYWAIESKGDEDAEVIRLAGLFTGLAIIAKISYLLPLVPGILLLIVWRYRASTGQDHFFSKPFLSTLLSMILWLLLWTAVPLFPHVIKNTMLFGQPLAPLISSTGTSITVQSWFTPETTRKIILTYPIALVYGQFWGQGGHFSPLFLAFTPLLVLLPRPKSFINNKFTQITLAGMIGIIAWSIYRPSVFAPRYIMASLLVLLLIGARGAEHVSMVKVPPPFFLATGLVLFIMTALVGGINDLRGVTQKALKIAVGRMTFCDIERTQTDGSCRIADIVNNDASPEDRVYLASYYSYWLRPNLIQCLATVKERSELGNIETIEARWNYLYEHGFRFLVFDTITHNQFLDVLDVNQIPDWLEVVTLFDESSSIAYRIASKDPNRRPNAVCGQLDPPAWQVVSNDDP